MSLDQIILPDGQVITKTRRGRGHSYVTSQGERVPSVTTILGVVNKPGLPNWASRMAAGFAIKETKQLIKDGNVTIANLNALEERARKEHLRVRDDAASIGIAIHSVVEARLEGRVVEPSREVPEFVVRNVDDFFTESLESFEVAYREEVVAHPLPFAGTLDAILKVGDKLILIDWKTSSGVYPEMALQVAAYAKAAKYALNVEIDEAWIIRFPKDDNPAELVTANIEFAWEAFKAAAQLHYAIQRQAMLWEDF